MKIYKIEITQKDIKKYKIQNTDSGYIIDELAFSVGQWTSNDMDENNIDYQPSEPYMFNFEDDMLENTKTSEQLYKLAKDLGVSLNANWERLASEKGLQVGATVALLNSDQWEELLTAYEDRLRSDYTGSISDEWNKELQGDIDSYHDNLYNEWLNGGRDSKGVVYEISKYYTENTDGEYGNKTHVYTFTMEEEDIQNAKDHGYNKNQLKSFLLSQIKESSDAKKRKEIQEREERKARWDKETVYKKDRAEREVKEREDKLLTHTA